jgi:hypothetical protein
VISNQNLWERTGQVPFEPEITIRKYEWIGKPMLNITRQSLEWNPEGKIKWADKTDLAKEYRR